MTWMRLSEGEDAPAVLLGNTVGGWRKEERVKRDGGEGGYKAVVLADSKQENLLVHVLDLERQGPQRMDM